MSKKGEIMKFEEKHQTMGLVKIADATFKYTDIYSDIVYTNLQTGNDTNIEELNEYRTPLMGIFTRKRHNVNNPDDKEYIYAGNVSQLYHFVGNEVLINEIKESISNNNQPIFKENIYLNKNATQMMAEIIIQNKTNVPSTGDVYPQIIVGNSYDGKFRISICYGLYIHDSNNKELNFGFRNKILKMNKIHKTGAETTLSDSIGQYIDIFKGNITDIINENFSKKLTEEDMLSTLDLIEACGKKRRESVSNALKDISSSGISAWDMFLAIIKFSSAEKNINAKLVLEDVAERVLTIPTQMMDLIESQ
jgi:hypothetical protein